MRLIRQLFCSCVLAACTGCLAAGPIWDPTPIAPGGLPNDSEANPAYLPLGPLDYGRVFETTLQVLGDYGFEIVEPNRYDGRVETVPRTAPGILLLAKPGSPDLRERWLSTYQSYRHRVTVILNPAESGGYFVEVIARKELEDLPRPVRSTIGGSIYRNDNNVDRTSEVIDETFFDPNWIYRGRDGALERELLRRIKKAL
jgi:hypothetical protein